MTQWEYRLVSLSDRTTRDGESTPDVILRVAAQLDALGSRGWEAVGEVHVAVPGQPVSGTGATVLQLLMKRPVEPGRR